MGLAISCMVIGALVSLTILVYEKVYKNISTNLTDFIGCASIIGFFGFIIGGLISIPLDSFLPRQWVKVGEVKLVSVRDQDGFQGSFFLGSGNIESVPYYFYYKELNNGGFQPSRVRANNQVTIYEEDRKNGKLEYYEYILKNQSLNWLVFDKSKGLVYDFRIPKGSIKRSFSL